MDQDCFTWEEEQQDQIAKTRTFAVRVLYEGPNAASVEDLGRRKLLRLSGTARDLGDPALHGSRSLIAQEDGSSNSDQSDVLTSISNVGQQHGTAPWMMPIEDFEGGVTRKLQSLQNSLGRLIDEEYALAWYSSFEATHSGLLDGVKTISKVRKHKKVVQTLQEPMKACMQQNGFVHLINISQDWPEFINMPAFFEVMAAALGQFPSASNLAQFFVECMQSAGASLSDMVEGPDITPSQKEAIDSLMELKQSDALDCALEWRALSQLRRPRNAFGHPFVKACSNDRVQAKILTVLEASELVNFTKDFSTAAKVCKAVATATRADKDTSPATFDFDFGPGF